MVFLVLTEFLSFTQLQPCPHRSLFILKILSPSNLRNLCVYIHEHEYDVLFIAFYHNVGNNTKAI